MEKYLKILRELNQTRYIHAANYLQKYRQFLKLSEKQKEGLTTLLPLYVEYLEKNFKIKGFGAREISSRTSLLNDYMNFYDENYNNLFTSQSKFRPTIIEEFLVILFNDLIEAVKGEIKDQQDILKIGGTQAYTNLFFSARNLKNFVDNPRIGINNKDQDFAIYRPITINIQSVNSIQANIPVVAIENKTYVDKTMLEGSIATAEKIKSGNPYTLFIIVTETWEVDLSVDPAYSRIDQVFVLRKSNSRKEGSPIFPEIFIDLVEMVSSHLRRNWSDVEQKLRLSGRII